MPRTKIHTTNAAKRNRNSATDEAFEERVRQLNQWEEQWKLEEDIIHEQRMEDFDRLMNALRQKMPDFVLKMTMGEFAAIEPNQCAAPAVVAENVSQSKHNSTNNASHRYKKLSEDIGYVTEESANSTTINRSIRPIGPLGSSKAAKNRRSRSAQNATSKNRSLIRSNSTVSAHASRQKFRTPAQSRLQTMSADRGGMNPVTPKMQLNTPVAFLRYPHMGETVMSLSGSPVIVQGNCQNGAANINIPIANGVMSLQPQTMSLVDCELASRIDPGTLEQLRLLQSNLNFIVSQADMHL